ncbi:MAG: hypothetical protein RLZZ262_455 [Bacteroidota bacterium]|jgi:hypothetical protein
MKGRAVQGLKWIAVAWGVWHVLATCIYTFHWPASGVLARMSYSYMVPLFHQNWALFAPNIPEYDAQLIYRNTTSDTIMDWSDWRDVSSACGYDEYSKMEVIEQNILIQLNYQLHTEYYSINGVPQFDAIVKTPAYSKALYYAGRMHEKHFGSWKDLQIAVAYRFAQPDIPIERSSGDTLFFPVFQNSEIKR